MILNKKNLILVAFLLQGGAAAARPRVVATFSLLGDWARQVGGSDADLAVLVGPDGDTHSYEPTPADARALAGADVVLEMGLGFEPWVDRLMDASGGRAHRVAVAAGTVPMAAGGGSVNPHVWGDVARVERIAETLRDAFVAADPARADAYRRRAAAYVSALKSLDEDIRVQTSKVSEGRRLLVTSHDTMTYWAARYGFRVVDVLFSSTGAESADLSAARLAGLSDRLRALKVPAIFVENVSNDRAARALARSAGVRVAPPLYTDALGAPGTPGDTYIGMMKYNARVIAEALK